MSAEPSSPPAAIRVDLGAIFVSLEPSKSTWLVQVHETSAQAMLAGIRGIGAESAKILMSEGLFRQFDNRRQVAAYAGLAPSPWHASCSLLCGST